MCPEPLTLAATLIGTGSAGADLLERLQARLSAADYKRTLIELVKTHVLSSEYRGGSRHLTLEHLETRSSIRDELLWAATADQFASCLRRMDVLIQDTLTKAEAHLLQTLETLAYAFGASRQDLISRSELASVSSELQRVSEAIERLPDVLIERVPDFNGSASSSTLDAIPGDESPAAINRIIDNFPLLTPWSERLDYATSYHEQLTDDGPDFGAYSRLVTEAQNGADDDVETAIENVAVLCVEGQPDTALERLEPIEARLPGHDLFRQAIYHRLRGALLLEVGSVPAASDAFARARRVLDRVSDQQKRTRAYAWLDRKLRFDELNLSANRFSDAAWQQDYEAARAVPAWPTHPAVDRAVAEFHRVLAKESFERGAKQESTYRSSDFLNEALLSFNRALLLAYLSGDHISVRAVRWEFAQGLIALPNDAWDDDYVRLFTDELLRAGDANAIAQFLRLHADRLAGVYTWTDVIARMKPRDPTDHDLGAYSWVRSRLAVVELMSPYLPGATLEGLNEEFTGEAVAFLASARHGLVRGRSFRESYFIDAFRSVEKLTPKLLRKLVVALDGSVGLRGLSFWEVVAVHDWQDGDRDVAETVLEQFQGRTLGYFDGGAVISQVMWRLGSAFPDLRPKVEGWLTENAAVDEDTKADAYTYRLYLSTAERGRIAPDIKAWLLDIYHGHLRALTGASSDGGPFGARRILLLPFAAREFPESFPAGERVDIVKGLLEASKNPNASPVQKVDAFSVAADLVPSLGDDRRLEIRESLRSSGEALGLARHRHEVVGFGLNHVAVQAGLLRLRVAAGVDPTPDDLTFILQALMTDARSETLAEVGLAAEALIQGGHHQETLLVALCNATSKGPKQHRAVVAAAKVLVRNLPPPDAPLHEMIVQRLENLVKEAAPQVMRGVTGQMIESWARLSAEAQSRFLAQTGGIKAGHKNRFAKSWAEELLSKAAEA